MSDQKSTNQHLNFDALAFEYVVGTLRSEERRVFERALTNSSNLSEAVLFWEEQLMAHHETTLSRQPLESTWDALESKLLHSTEQLQNKESSWARYFDFHKYAFSFMLALVVIVSAWLFIVPDGSYAPNADYVAVLTNEQDAPLLTALTSIDGNTLWLRWESDLVVESSSVQLWAQSRRDGEIRPLHVFDVNGVNEVALDEAATRLVRDSEYLILTLEEQGGSSIDEPSEHVLAKGVCVRLNSNTI